MKNLIPLLLLGFVIGCASDPLLTGKPQHWKGKRTSDLQIAYGEPTKISKDSMGELWEYRKSGEFNAPKEDRTEFKMSGSSGFGFFGAGGGISKLQFNEGLRQVEDVLKFRVKKDRIVGWSAMRLIDGQVVWQDH